MRSADEMDAILQDTLDDLRLSRSERKALTAVLAEHAQEAQTRALFRHRAFELARQQMHDPRDKAVLDWLEEVAKALAASANDDAPKLAEAHFSPGDDCRRRILSLCRHSRRSIDVCVFTITDDTIAHALLEAHERGVRLRVITDDDKSGDIGSDIARLARAGIEVRLDHSEHHMHHKFALFDGTYLLTGSYNWTRSAASSNEENVVVSDDPRLVGAFGETFESLWQTFGIRARGG